MKKKYRRRLLQSMLQATEGEVSNSDFLKKTNMKDVVYWIAESWDEVKAETINKSWNKILKKQPEETDPEDDVPLAELIRKLPGCENTDESEVAEWLQNDQQHKVSDQAIIEMISEPAEGSDDDDEDMCAETVKVMTHSEGLATLEAALIYVEQQPEATSIDTMLLRRWHDSREEASLKVEAKDIRLFF
uniref:DDE-1 domain-containing protein n=1 Tax=Graphocephala atropunctata TaxID=36148 RepID=A0A1B6M902_9HEMI